VGEVTCPPAGTHLQTLSTPHRHAQEAGEEGTLVLTAAAMLAGLKPLSALSGLAGGVAVTQASAASTSLALWQA